MPPAERKLRGPQLYTQTDIAALSGAAFLARLVLDELLAQARSGVLPLELASVCLERIELAGAKPVMVDVIGDQGQPFGHACAVSTDDTIAHALPDEQPLRTGQLANIDLLLSLDGWHADVADTVVVGGGGHPLLDALDAVWQAGLKAIAPGVAWSDVAAAMAGAAEAHDVRLVQGLAGHGIGLAPHELPALPLVPKPSDPPVILRPGMVFTLEPAITSGSGGTVDSEDGWAIRTADGSPAVAREAMIVVENEQTRVLGAS